MSSQVSYSFHISSKKNAISTLQKLRRVALHNDRSYKSEEYNKDNIEHIVGSDNTYNDVKKVYRIFEPAKDTYNRAQKREDRKIKDYMQHVSDSRNDVATEIIIQIGDAEFWKDKSLEERKKMRPLLILQVKKLQKLMPNFIIANAVIHWDEKSPHVQVVGVPVCKENNKRGMNWQCIKTKVFTEESLTMLQAEMHKLANWQARRVEFKKTDGTMERMTVKDKEIGRNLDFSKNELTAFKKQEANMKRAMRKAVAEEEKLLRDAIKDEIDFNRSCLEDEIWNARVLAEEELEEEKKKAKKEQMAADEKLKNTREEIKQERNFKEALLTENERLDKQISLKADILAENDRLWKENKALREENKWLYKVINKVEACFPAITPLLDKLFKKRDDEAKKGTPQKDDNAR